MAAVTEAASDLLELLADVSPAQLPNAPEHRAIAMNHAGVALFWLGRLGQAEARLRSAMALAESAGIELTQLNAMSHLALLEAEQGRLREACEHARRGLELARRRGWHGVLQIVPAYLALALTNIERNALGEAAEAFTDGLAAQRTDPETVQYFALRIAEARILLARREIDAARLVTHRIGQEISPDHTPPVLARWLMTIEAQINLSAGKPDEVLRTGGSTENGNPADPRMRICVAWAHLALGDLRTAETVLTPLHTSAPDVRSAVEAWLVTALVEDALRQNNRSAESFARAIALAEPEGIRRPFVGIERSRVSALLERHQWLVPDESPFVTELLADATSEPSASVPAQLIEALTDRELDVLHYLPTMLRNHDIADQMNVSVNTIKAHLRALYRKLGVTQRHQAVDRARELGLL
jgi:LuxR family maltose regulon positive regulatory protein